MSIGAGSPKFRIWGDYIRRLKVKQQRGKSARQALAQFRNVLRCGAMLTLFQGNQDLAVKCADGGLVAESKVEGFSGAPDVIKNEFSLAGRDWRTTPPYGVGRSVPATVDSCCLIRKRP
jgi:hypothetical protein